MDCLLGFPESEDITLYYAWMSLSLLHAIIESLCQEMTSCSSQEQERVEEHVRPGLWDGSQCFFSVRNVAPFNETM